MTTFGALKQGGGVARNGAQKPPLFFRAGLLAEVPKSFLGSIKIPIFYGFISFLWFYGLKTRSFYQEYQVFLRFYKVLALLMKSWFPGNVDFTKAFKGILCFWSDISSPFWPESLIFLRFLKVFEANLVPFLVLSVPFRARPGWKTRRGVFARFWRFWDLGLLSKGGVLAGFLR